MTREPLEQSIDHARSAELHLTAVRCYISLKSKPEGVPVEEWMKQDETPVDIHLPAKDIDGEIAFHTLAAQVHASLAIAAAQQ